MDVKRAGNTRRLCWLCGAAALITGPGIAEPALARCAPEPWEPARILAEAADEAVALERFPESASALRRRIGAAHRDGDSARVRAAMTRLADMGYTLSPQSLDQLAAHFDLEQVAAIRSRFDASRTHLGWSHPVDSVPAERRLIEAIATDPRTGRLFATSVVGRELLVHDAIGWRPIAGVEGGSLFGMVLDPTQRRLWIASGALDQTPSPATAFRGLIAVDLDTLRTVERIPAPDLGSPGDVTIAPDGTLYASDPIGGAIFRTRPGALRLTALVPSGRFRSPQGMVVSSDGTRLYVADYAYGIGIVDLVSGAVTRLTAREPAMLDGVDGLLADGDALIAIQNGTSPRRIVRLRLEGGCEVAGIEILERATPEWGEPTLGSISGGELLYVADGQWERYGPAGAVVGDAPLRPTSIRALPLRSAAGRSGQ
jgi:sugar lactone lactonase YvrE